MSFERVENKNEMIILHVNSSKKDAPGNSRFFSQAACIQQIENKINCFALILDLDAHITRFSQT